LAKGGKIILAKWLQDISQIAVFNITSVIEIIIHLEFVMLHFHIVLKKKRQNSRWAGNMASGCGLFSNKSMKREQT